MNGYVVVSRDAGGWAWRFEVLRRDGTRGVLRSGCEPTEAAAREAARAVAFEWECGRI